MVLSAGQCPETESLISCASPANLHRKFVHWFSREKRSQLASTLQRAAGFCRFVSQVVKLAARPNLFAIFAQFAEFDLLHGDQLDPRLFCE